MVATRFSTFTGQPGSAIVWPPTTSRRLAAFVTPPPAPGTPPSKAQAPTAIVASAPSATSRTTSANGRPPTRQNASPAPVGMAPSTTTT